MEKKKGIVRTIINTAKAHVRDTINGIKENATNVAKEDYNIDLKVLQPKIKDLFTDLKKWNAKRKEDARLSREELKEVGKAILTETKKVVMDPESVKDQDMEEFNELFGDEFNFDFDDEEFTGSDGLESEGMQPENNIQAKNVSQITPREVGLFTLAILTGITNPVIKAYLVNNLDDIKERICGQDTEAFEDVRRTLVDAVYSTAPEEPAGSQSEEIMNEIEIAGMEAELNIALASDSIKKIGTISEIAFNEMETCVVDTLYRFQADAGFADTMDRIYTNINVILTSAISSVPQGTLEYTNPMDYVLSNPLVTGVSQIFNINALEAIAIVAIFTSYGQDSEEEQTKMEEILTKMSEGSDSLYKIATNTN